MALAQLTATVDRQIEVPHFGIALIRMHRTQENSLLIDIGAGEVNERMSTLGVNVPAPVDADQAVASPAGRAFKHSNAFCLIDDDEIVLCLDGEFRVKQVAYYFRQLFGNANLSPQHQAFEINAVTNLDKEQVLTAEGVKELHLDGVAYEAAHDLNDDYRPGVLDSLKSNVRALLESQVGSDAERTELASNYANLNVRAVISVKGGARGEPVLIDTLSKAGEELLDNQNDQDKVWLKTKKGSTISVGELVLGCYENITRHEGQNDLDRHEVWDKLIEFRTGLRQNGMWAQ